MRVGQQYGQLFGYLCTKNSIKEKEKKCAGYRHSRIFQRE